jgi:hypothetical protein
MCCPISWGFGISWFWYLVGIKTQDTWYVEEANIVTVAMNLRLIIENFMKVGIWTVLPCLELPANVKYSTAY